MELNARLEGDEVLVIELREDNLDAGNVREFREAVHAMIQNRHRVVFDMVGVKFVDSSGLGAMISCQRMLNAQHGEFRLCNMKGSVRALFELMRMHRVFHIHASRDEAVAAFHTGATA